MIHKTRHARFAAISGFTLLEVLVSCAVLAIVLTIMFSALSTSMSLWRNTDSKIAADREARAVELLLVRDLANVVMPASTDLWPKTKVIRSKNGPRGANDFYLGFLTTAPAEMQSASNSVGDVCYAEYAVVVVKDGPGFRREVRRFFWNSDDTFANVLGKTNGLPDLATQAASNYQSLGLNLLPTNNMAARRLGSLVSEANNTNLVLLGTDMLPFSGTPSSSNYPVAIEVNFSVADRTTLANPDIIGNPGYVLRNAGLYSFRIPLPKPPSAP